MNSFDWVDVVGYQHEVVHTGVLRWLLESDDFFEPVSKALGVETVLEPPSVELETRVPGFRGTPDLRAEYRTHEAQPFFLAVETKVDSRATQAQLANTIGPSIEGSPMGIGTLLALGVSALCLETDDLPADLREFGWRSTGPRDWHSLLAEELRVPELVPGLETYLSRIEEEARLQDQAVLIARNEAGRPEEPLPRELEEFAWFREIRSQMSAGDGAIPRSEWHTKREISGPLMGLFPRDWRSDKGEVFLEFASDWTRGQRRRSLCVKVAGGSHDVTALADPLLELARKLGSDFNLQEARRRPASNAKTYTPVRMLLNEESGQQAAELTERLRSGLDVEIKDLVGN